MSLSEDIRAISAEEGFDCPSQWVAFRVTYCGWTFEQLAQYIADVYRRYYCWHHIYGVCRPYLPGPLQPARFRKWNPVARQKGFSSGITMFREFAKKGYSPVDVAIDLNISSMQVRILLGDSALRLSNKLPERSKRKSKFGFKQTKAQMKWKRWAEGLGYKSVRTMLKRNEGKSLANKLGVSEQTICGVKRKVGL